MTPGELPLIQQLSNLLQNQSSYDDIFSPKLSDHNNMSDLTDGELYQNFNRKTGQQKAVSFSWNTDGVSIFRSSNYNIWPFYLTVNEMSEHKRFKDKNMLLAGLWFGPKKPQMQTFLQPIYKSLKSIENGFEIETVNCTEFIHAYVLFGTADLQARAIALNMVQFNGFNSCHKCLNPGVTFRTQRGGSSHVYEQKAFPERTDASVQQGGRQAANEGTVELGIKGPSPFTYFKFYSFVKGTCIDPMHQVFLGLMKQLTTLWFSPTYKSFPFSVWDKSHRFDSRLSQLKPPHTINRSPRPSSDFKHYKASEFCALLVMYVLMLYSILPIAQFDHIMLLSQAIFLLYSRNIPLVDLPVARNALDRFCADFANPYGNIS